MRKVRRDLDSHKTWCFWDQLFVSLAKTNNWSQNTYLLNPNHFSELKPWSADTGCLRGPKWPPPPQNGSRESTCFSRRFRAFYWTKGSTEKSWFPTEPFEPPKKPRTAGWMVSYGVRFRREGRPLSRSPNWSLKTRILGVKMVQKGPQNESWESARFSRGLCLKDAKNVLKSREKDKNSTKKTRKARKRREKCLKVLKRREKGTNGTKKTRKRENSAQSQARFG